MRETVEFVREGWYGNVAQWETNNQHMNDNYRCHRKEPTDCKALFNH
jgi:hypothetical protein